MKKAMAGSNIHCYDVANEEQAVAAEKHTWMDHYSHHDVKITPYQRFMFTAWSTVARSPSTRSNPGTTEAAGRMCL